MRWNLVVKVTEAEESFMRGLGARSKFYVILRKVRHQLFDAAMQCELETMFSPKPRGNKPVPAAQLAMLIRSMPPAPATIMVDESRSTGHVTRQWA